MNGKENGISLIRWEPFRESEDFVSRVMPALWRRWPMMNGAERGASEWMPTADISETEKEFLIRAESKDGMLTVHMPKAKVVAVKPVQVKVD